jgi:hypothetical protein
VTTTSPDHVAPKAEEPPASSTGHDHALQHLPRWLTLTTGTAVLALATGGLGLVYTFWPGLRPDPRVTQSATMTVMAIDRHVARKDFEPQNQLPVTSDRVNGCTFGMVFYLQEHLEGFKGQTTLLKVYRYDAISGVYMNQVFLNAKGALVLRGTRPTDQSVQPIWIAWSPGSPPLFYRFELYRGKDNMLSLTDSPAVPMPTAAQYAASFHKCYYGD